MKAFGKSYKDVEAASGGDFKKLPAGGYICEIKAVEDVPAKEYLRVVYDVATGEFKGYYADEWGQEHPFAHCMYWSYKDTNKKYFKANMAAVDKTNMTDFNTALEETKDFNEQQLVGKKIGLIIGYEEYKTDRGEIRERTYVVAVRSTDGLQEWLGKVAKGEAKLPELKKLKEEVAPASPYPEFVGLKDSDIPF